MNFIYFYLFSFLNNLYSEESLGNTYQINEDKGFIHNSTQQFLITDKVTNKTSLEDLKILS